MAKSLILAFALGLILLLTDLSNAYIAVSATRLTLCEVMLEFPRVLELKLEKYKAETGAGVFTVETVFQGEKPANPIRMVLRDGEQNPQRLRGMKVGDVVIAFMGSPDHRSLIHSDGGWWLAVPDQGWERFTQFRDDFQSLFTGTPAQLGAAIMQLQRGGAVVVPVQPKGLAQGEQLYVRYDAQFPHRRWPALPPKHQAMKPDQIALAAVSKSVVDRQHAMLEMRTMPDAEKELRQGLADSHSEVRLAAVASLGQRMKLSSESLQALVKRLEDEDRFVCAFAAWALGQSGKDAEFAVPALLKALELRDHDHDYRPLRSAEAAEAILRLVPESKAAQRAVQFFLTDRMLKFHRVDAEGTRTAAARALGRSGGAARSALPDLLICLKDDVAETRVAAAEAILLISREAKDRAPALNLLQNEIAQGKGLARIQAIRAGSSTGEAALIPVLTEQLNEADEVIQLESRKAIDSIKDKR